jgi:hypothetical protein
VIERQDLDPGQVAVKPPQCLPLSRVAVPADDDLRPDLGSIFAVIR